MPGHQDNRHWQRSDHGEYHWHNWGFSVKIVKCDGGQERDNSKGNRAKERELNKVANFSAGLKPSAKLCGALRAEMADISFVLRAKY
jgi:hypothetical protein